MNKVADIIFSCKTADQLRCCIRISEFKKFQDKKKIIHYCIQLRALQLQAETSFNYIEGLTKILSTYPNN